MPTLRDGMPHRGVRLESLTYALHRGVVACGQKFDQTGQDLFAVAAVEGKGQLGDEHPVFTPILKRVPSISTAR
jgi:hypothetical protein